MIPGEGRVPYTIRVNYLVPFRVVKSLPDHDAYLCNIIGTEIFAQLPREYAIRKYSVGDTDWASVFAIRGARITLTQKSPAYIRRLIEYLLRDELIRNGLSVKKVVRYQDYIKVMLKGDNRFTNSALAEIFRPWLSSEERSRYFPGQTLVFVMYREDIPGLIRSVLLHEDLIQQVYYLEDLATALVYTDNGSTGAIIGQGGRNIITARKLLAELGLNITIEIKTA